MTTTYNTFPQSAHCRLLGVLALCALWAAPLQVQAQAAGGTEVVPGVNINAAAAAKIEKMSSDPFRWIILHANTVRTPVAEPVPAATATSKPRAAPARTTAPRTVSAKPAEALAIATPKPEPAPQANNPSIDVNEQGMSEGAVLHKVFDFGTAKLRDDGAIETASGAYVAARVNTYSAKSPNPVEASSSFDKARKLVRVDYSVPETVGSSGGAGVRINVEGDGVDLKQLVNGENVNGMLVIDIDASAATSLKIALLGPSEHPQGAYPYFRLPVEPGLRTYGLMLADFVQAPWSSTASDIATALTKVIGIEVEYSRGFAMGKADKGSFWVGNIRISNVQQVAAAKK
jgi:hypothetical protein